MQNIWKQAINREKYILDDIVTSNGRREGGRIIVAVLYNNYCIGGFKGFVNKLYFLFTFSKATSRHDKKKA